MNDHTPQSNYKWHLYGKVTLCILVTLLALANLILVSPAAAATDARTIEQIIPDEGQEPNTDRPGSDYRKFPQAVANPMICQQACNNDPNCKAWTYVEPGYQGPAAMCWLKDSVPQAQPSSCCISGVAPRGKQAIFVFFNNYNCANSDGISGVLYSHQLNSGQIVELSQVGVDNNAARSLLLITLGNPAFHFVVFDRYPTEDRSRSDGWIEHSVSGDGVMCIRSLAPRASITRFSGNIQVNEPAIDYHYNNGSEPSAIGIWWSCRWGYRCSY